MGLTSRVCWELYSERYVDHKWTRGLWGQEQEPRMSPKKSIKRIGALPFYPQQGWTRMYDVSQDTLFQHKNLRAALMSEDTIFPSGMKSQFSSLGDFRQVLSSVWSWNFSQAMSGPNRQRPQKRKKETKPRLFLVLILVISCSYSCNFLFFFLSTFLGCRGLPRSKPNILHMDCA